MPLVPFREWKADVILQQDDDGNHLITQTIRETRVHPIKVGDILYCWRRCRQPDTEKIFLSSPYCTSVRPISLLWNNGDILVYVDGSNHPLSRPEVEQLAIADGFGNADRDELARDLKLGKFPPHFGPVEMFFEFFAETLEKQQTFDGNIITWAHPRPFSPNPSDIGLQFEAENCGWCKKEFGDNQCPILTEAFLNSGHPEWINHPITGESVCQSFEQRALTKAEKEARALAEQGMVQGSFEDALFFLTDMSGAAARARAKYN